MNTTRRLLRLVSFILLLGAAGFAHAHGALPTSVDGAQPEGVTGKAAAVAVTDRKTSSPPQNGQPFNATAGDQNADHQCSPACSAIFPSALSIATTLREGYQPAPSFAYWLTFPYPLFKPPRLLHS